LHSAIVQPVKTEKGLKGLQAASRKREDEFFDLMIEQMLMRSVKSSGGLTRGRGMSEFQRALWLLSMPACGDISSAMQEATDMEFFTSEQHTESTTARMKRDDKDMKELLKYMLPRNPFTFNLAMSLRSISTGVTADPTTNVDRAKDIGLSIVESMVGKAVSEFKFKKKDQAVTMDVKRCARVDGERLQVDPQLLFQRLVTAAAVQREDGDLCLSTNSQPFLLRSLNPRVFSEKQRNPN
jgi:hypothetical protein